MAVSTRVVGASLLTALIGVVITAADARAATETLQVTFNTSDNSAIDVGFWANIPPNPPTYEHVVAVWLEDAGGNYVKTLVRWADIYPHDLRAWAQASDLDVDAVTGATRSSAGPHTTGSIDITMIPDQTYRIQLESSDLNAPGLGLTNRATYTFSKNGSGAVPPSADQGGFTGVTITYSGRSGGGYAPGVHAGPERWITLPNTLSLAGLATSDAGISSVTWDTVSGPASVTFTPPDALSTTASFPREGVYVLGLTVTDGAALQSTGEVTILVNAVDLFPVADSEVSSVSPGVSWPNNDFRIRVWKQTDAEKEREGFVKFDLSGVPGEATGALLRLSMNDWWPLTGGNLTCDVQGVGDGWIEGLGGITWNNSRSLTGATLASFWANNPLWTEMDVSSFVAAEHASDQTASFHVLHRNVHNTSGSRFNSREKNVKPTLRVTYNRLPTVSISSPTSGQTFNVGVSISFSCTAADPDGTALSYSWVSDLDGQIGTADSFSSTSLSAGDHTVTVTVTDASGGQAQDSVAITVGNSPPQATITSPQDGAKSVEGETVTFTGTVYDPNPGDTHTFTWSSSVDGFLGTGASLSKDTLSPANHTITLTVSDGQLDDTETVSIEVYRDTDGDGMPDWWEDQYAALDSTVPDAGADPDGDGFSNLQEYRSGTDPTVANTSGDSGTGFGCAAGGGSLLGCLALAGAILELLRRRSR